MYDKDVASCYFSYCAACAACVILLQLKLVPEAELPRQPDQILRLSRLQMRGGLGNRVLQAAAITSGKY